MKRTFRLNIARSLDDCYDLLEKSGDAILSWHKQPGNREHCYLEWKQSIWSFSGSAVIIAQLEKVQEKETAVIIDVIKPFQLFDPLNLSSKIFRKLEESLEQNLKHTDRER